MGSRRFRRMANLAADRPRLIGAAFRWSCSRRGAWIGWRPPFMQEKECPRLMVDDLADQSNGWPLDSVGQACRRLESGAAGQHAAVRHMTAVMVTTRHLSAAAIRADDIAENIALDGRRGDSESRLQHEHQRRDESREPRHADPVDALPHGLPDGLPREGLDLSRPATTANHPRTYAAR